MDYQVSAVLDTICKKFGVTIDYLYPKIVRYCTVMSTAGIISGFILLIGGIIATLIGYRVGSKWAMDDEWRDWYDHGGSLGTVILGSSIVVIGAVVLPINLYNLVSVFVTPEIAALKYIASLLD